MRLRFREQPGAAREPSIACRPNGQLATRFRTGDRRDGVQVHRYANTFNAILLSVTVLQDQRQSSWPFTCRTARIMAETQAIWIKDPIGILAEHAARGVVVRGGRIVELVPAGGAPMTADAVVFDASAHVVLPGLIHTH